MTNSKQPLVLIVDDEAPIRHMIALNLNLARMRFQEAEDETSTFNAIEQERPDVILLDWMLPGTSGIEIAKKLRRSDLYRNIPVIMLTAKAEIDNKIKGLESGSDDYMVKPFSPKELIARIRSVLRRFSDDDDDGFIELGELRLNTFEQLIQCGDKQAKLSNREFQLLRFFITHPKRIYTRQQLLDHVWGMNKFLDERSIDVQVRRVRQALAKVDAKPYLQTVRGNGYRFAKPQ